MECKGSDDGAYFEIPVGSWTFEIDRNFFVGQSQFFQYDLRRLLSNVVIVARCDLHVRDCMFDQSCTVKCLSSRWDRQIAGLYKARGPSTTGIDLTIGPHIW